MKLRGTRGGILLSIAADEPLEAVLAQLEAQRGVLAGRVMLELGERLSYRALEAIAAKIREHGGELVELRPPKTIGVRGETVILAKTVRSGARIESSASVIILGDVNAGAEIIAEDDIIVIGTLRGIAHAGASGNERAVIWAQRILSPQLRIAGALAQADGSRPERLGAEIAQLQDGQIILRPWDR